MSGAADRQEDWSDMRMIVAFVQPFMASRVMTALHQVDGVSGATFSDARGFGRGRRIESPIPEIISGTAERTRVDVVVPATLEDAVVRAIREAAHTGNRGDGKIYVVPIRRAVRISTGEEGNGAV